VTESSRGRTVGAMAETDFTFPKGVKVPARLASLRKFVASCDDDFSGDLELHAGGADAMRAYFRDTPEVASQFAVFAHDGMDSQYGFWMYDGLSIDKAPVVYLNGEGSDCTVLANSFDEFLGLLAGNYPMLGFYKEWKAQAENSATHAKFRR